jgi:hypothetical protein
LRREDKDGKTKQNVRQQIMKIIIGKNCKSPVIKECNKENDTYGETSMDAIIDATEFDPNPIAAMTEAIMSRVV